MSEVMTEYSIEEERKIAKTFMGRVEWEMIVIGIGQCLIWFGLWFIGGSRRYGFMAWMYPFHTVNFLVLFTFACRTTRSFVW